MLFFLCLQEFPKADFSAAIFTYHFGYDNLGWPSLERTAQLFDKMGESNVYYVTIESHFSDGIFQSSIIRIPVALSASWIQERSLSVSGSSIDKSSSEILIAQSMYASTELLAPSFSAE